MKSLKVIVPCYNEEKGLGIFYEALVKELDLPNYDYEIIFINDGSKDKTLVKIKELASINPKVRYLSFSRNFGKESAMYAGLKLARNASCAVIIDADLQHDPKFIKNMVEEYEKGFKLVYTRKKKRSESFFKKVILKFFYVIFRMLTKMKMENGVNDFQFLDKAVIKAYLEMPDQERFLKGIFTYVGFSKKCLDIPINKRVAGKTSWNYRKLIKYALRGINQFSNYLLIFPKLGILVSFLAFFVNGYLFYQELITRNELFILLEINIFAFLLFITLYALFYLIYGIRKEVIKRPLYLVEECNIDE